MEVADPRPTVTARVTGSLHISDQVRLLRFSSPDIVLPLDYVLQTFVRVGVDVTNE